jgi:hypothetical protein
MGFCGSGAGRKASVISSNSVQLLSQPTFIYWALVLNFNKIFSIGLPSLGATFFKYPTDRKALFVGCYKFGQL